jgi:SacI homology domain
MFHVFLDRDCFYFSHTFDLTNPLNKLAQKGSLSIKLSSCDERFFYNQPHVSRLISEGFHDWVTPFICGLVDFKLIKVNGKSVNLGLISRRDRTRAGMRFI